MKKGLTITGGMYKNKSIACPLGIIRPAMASMRKTLFQVLANLTNTQPDTACANMRVVDLFSGSGLIGLECLSRQASFATLVEGDTKKYQHIISNLQKVLDEKNAKSMAFLYKDKVERFLLRNTKKYDLIYCDPPFDYKHKNDLLKKIAQSRVLYPSIKETADRHSIVIIHVPAKISQLKKNYITASGTLTQIDMRFIGGSALYFYQN